MRSVHDFHSRRWISAASFLSTTDGQRLDRSKRFLHGGCEDLSDAALLRLLFEEDAAKCAAEDISIKISCRRSKGSGRSSALPTRTHSGWRYLVAALSDCYVQSRSSSALPRLIGASRKLKPEAPSPKQDAETNCWLRKPLQRGHK